LQPRRFAVPLAVAARDYPDEGTMPLHRAVTKVKQLPEMEAWAADWLRKSRGAVRAAARANAAFRRPLLLDGVDARVGAET